MKHYVVRFTLDRYGRKVGEYAKGQTPTSNGGTPDLQKAYVYNTRMNRHGAVHNLTEEQRAAYGYELVWVNIVVAQ